MKKVGIVLLAMVFAMGMALTAQAANVVDVRTTSEAIQKVGCEKAGSISFTFDAGSVINEGQWWFADLPIGVTICSPINFQIVDGAPGTAFGDRGETFVTPPANGTTLTLGTSVVSINDIGGIVGTGGIDAAGPNATAGVFFQVVGNVGSQRILITAMGTDPAIPGDESLTVLGDTTFTIKILDQQLNLGFMFEDTNGNGLYGDTLPADALEAIDNTLCINAQNLAGNLVNVSYDSLGDFFTFTGDNEVAHAIAAIAMSLQACKGLTSDSITLETTQTTVCSVDYETAAGRYCGPAFTGNRAIISVGGGATFEDADYAVRLTVVSPANGVYWANPNGPGGVVITGFTPAENSCGAGGNAVAGQNYVASDGAGNPIAAFNTGTCAVAANQRAKVVETNSTVSFGNTNLDPIATWNALWINMPTLVFDSTVVQPNDVLTVRVELIKLPCGVLFSGTRDLGTFVSVCGVAPAPGQGNLVMPYFPPMDPAFSSGWWGGFAIYNNTASDGTASITVFEQDGDSGTYDAPVPANGLFVITNDALIPLLATTDVLGDSPVYIFVETDWATGFPGLDMAGAFFMMGNGIQAQGGAVEANY